MTRNLSLDFFRGAFALAVALGHFYHWNGIRDIVPSSFILAVDFFFILSGFVLTKSVLADKRSDSNWFISFTEKRFYRIFPTFLFVVAIHFVILRITKNIPYPTGLDLFRITTLTQLFPFGGGSNYTFEPMGVGWSISAEFWLGMVFFAVVHALKARHSGVLLSCLILISLWLVVLISRTSPAQMNAHYQLWNNGIPFGFIRCLVGFCLGAAVAIHVRSTQISELTESIVQIIVIGVGLYLFAKTTWIGRDSFIAPFIFTVLIYSLASQAGIIYHLTNNRVGDFLGKISFAVYLAHPIFVLFVKEHMDMTSLSAVLSYLMMVIGAGYLLHVFIEQPAIDYVNRKQRASRSNLVTS
ncbi:acyltransferase [Pseudomonas sp. SCB32]|uniref:acyltransferase family protein n=1 Tax=Pseudomonas sp. SCB32 TaxID=2653853 RepID=UPI002115C74F|nr:acyltransferase [Pseudomonas sp. SCB32]